MLLPITNKISDALEIDSFGWAIGAGMLMSVFARRTDGCPHGPIHGLEADSVAEPRRLRPRNSEHGSAVPAHDPPRLRTPEPPHHLACVNRPTPVGLPVRAGPDPDPGP